MATRDEFVELVENHACRHSHLSVFGHGVIPGYAARVVEDAKSDVLSAWDALAAENARLRAALADFAEHGTRHDLCPSLSWSSEQELAVAFTRYIKRMDDHVREYARRALNVGK